MLQADRNWLFEVAYSLDNRPRVEPKEINKEFKRLSDRTTSNTYCIFTAEELDKWAESIRRMACKDQDRIAEGR